MIKITVGGPQATIKLNARKTLEGDLLIADHDIIDIALVPSAGRIITFPKSDSVKDPYGVQTRFFNFLANKGIIYRDSVQGGNAFGSLEALIPPSEKVNGLQAALYVISQFIVDEEDARVTAEEYEKDLEKYFTEPTDRDSTELGEVPQEAEKGAMVPGYYYIPLRYKM